MPSPAFARARVEKSPACASPDQLQEGAEVLGEPGARQEVEQLEGEEERDDQHHDHVEHALEQDLVDEAGIDADVQHAQRTGLPVDRQRHDVQRCPRACAALPAECSRSAIGVGDREVGELRVLGEDLGERPVHAVEFRELHAELVGLEQQRPHRSAHGDRGLRRFGHELALEGPLRGDRHQPRRGHHRHHDDPREAPVDTSQVGVVDHQRAASTLAAVSAMAASASCSRSPA